MFQCILLLLAALDLCQNLMCQFTMRQTMYTSTCLDAEHLLGECVQTH